MTNAEYKRVKKAAIIMIENEAYTSKETKLKVISYLNKSLISPVEAVRTIYNDSQLYD